MVAPWWLLDGGDIGLNRSGGREDFESVWHAQWAASESGRNLPAALPARVGAETRD